MAYKIIDDFDLHDFDPDNYVEDISDEAIISEYELRGFGKNDHTAITEPLYMRLQSYSKMKLHDFLADVVGLQHTVSNDEIINELKNMM